MQNVSFDNVQLRDGFWRDKYNLNANISIKAVQERFEETGRFDAVRFKKTDSQPHIFYDSDVAKWIEAVAYLLQIDRNRHKDLEVFCDSLIDSIGKNQKANGYFNSYYQTVENDKTFTDRSGHELYCAGHFIEAAIAYHKATGKTSLLHIMDRYCDYIIECFPNKKSAAFLTCGHQEIELALLKWYDYTLNIQYRYLAEFFINSRGNNDKDKDLSPDLTKKYSQDNAPVRELFLAEGHAVRAVYLYTAMAHFAKLTDDTALADACKRIFDDISKKMYVTGAIGSSSKGEAFTVEYDLPNLTAYAETCAGIGLMYFCMRMTEVEKTSRYADMIERILYNCFLSSFSIKGDSFFYQNPLEVCIMEKHRETAVTANLKTQLPDTIRQKVFTCSCCPPNINRFLASVANIIYSQTDEGVYINQFISSNYKNAGIQIETSYPLNGFIKITGTNYAHSLVFMRIPTWCNKYSLKLNGKILNSEIIGGYAKISVEKHFEIELRLDIEPVFIFTHPKVRAGSGKVCMMAGPVVYCLEEADNGPDLHNMYLKTDKNFNKEYSAEFSQNTYTYMGYRRVANSSQLYTKSTDFEKIMLKFIPYNVFANRGECDMTVWINHIPKLMI